MGFARKKVRALRPATERNAPTIGAIKHALHELSRAGSPLARGDSAANLQQAYDQLRQLAVHNGIDPDSAVRQRLAAIQALRERMILLDTTGPDRRTA